MNMMKNKNSLIKRENLILKIIFTGFLSGFFSGLFSSGGGLIAIPCFLYLFNCNEREARANTVFCIIPIVASTIIIYNKANYFDVRLSILSGIGGILGGIIGVKLLNKMKDKYLSIIFIAFLIYSAIFLIIKK